MSIVCSNNITDLLESTLNHIDSRLVDHGKRVAFVVSKMIGLQNKYSQKQKQDICILAMLHDIGAYKTEEIDKMVEFETENIWDHSVFGYLFLYYLSPLKALAPVILLHHQNCNQYSDDELAYKELAQIIYLADRADIFLAGSDTDDKRLFAYYKKYRNVKFAPEIIDLFLKANELYNFKNSLKEIHDFHSITEELSFTDEEIDTYLKMLIFTIDFRSYHTVTHSITTTQISKQLAKLMHLDEQTKNHVYYGAMLHDLGKIGIPVEILEFPGKLSPQAMRIMRTHVEITEKILYHKIDQTTLNISLRHHEKLDGSGYPRGLCAENLSCGERIVAVADIISALFGTRSYKDSFSKEKTLDILTNMSRQNLLDAEIVKIVTANYDGIMEQVRMNCAPVIDIYDTIQSEHVRIMKKYAAKSNWQVN